MTSFSEHCKSVVKEYIHTVMIIDDGAGLDNQGIVARDLVIPSSNDPFSASESEEIPIETVPPGHITHSLDTFSLTNAFFEEGIVAGIYQPQIEDSQTPEAFASRTSSVCDKADIIILDWILKDRNPEYSKAVVKEILRGDHKNGGRVRAIIVYTGESNLHYLRDELFTYLNIDELDRSSDYEIRSENIIISFYNKNHGGYSFTPDRAMSESEIPQQALNSFTVLVDGLVPVFAMKSAASIRRNTGRIISRFRKNLDTAYLAHRALLPEPEDSEVFMLDNFVSYMRNILAISRIDNATLGADSIEQWIREHNEILDKKIKHGNNEYQCELNEMIELSQHGFLSRLYQILKSKKNAMCNAYKDTSKITFLQAISIFNRSDINVVESSVELSILSLFRRTFKDIIGTSETPYLTQGSLIYSKNKDQFLLCVTPKCDTVRIEEITNFSFVILNEVMVTDQEIDKEFDIVIPKNKFVIENKIKNHIPNKKDEIKKLIVDHCLTNKGKASNNTLHDQLKELDSIKNGNYMYLRTQPKFNKLKHILFDSEKNKKVSFNNTMTDLIDFFDADCNEYIWIGDLHDLNTITRVGNLVSNLNRTGTDEVEWLRRKHK